MNEAQGVFGDDMRASKGIAIKLLWIVRSLTLESTLVK